MGQPRAEVIGALCLAGEGETVALSSRPSPSDCQGYATGCLHGALESSSPSLLEMLFPK